MIVEVIQSYYPAWKPPSRLSGTRWNKVRCPNPEHQDSEPSASLSLSQDRIRCFACGFQGDVYDLIQLNEGCSFKEAKELARELGGLGSELRAPQGSSRFRSVEDAPKAPRLGISRRFRGGVDSDG